MRDSATSSAHTPTVENYLKALYLLAVPGRGVGTSELAARLHIRAASVTHMLQRLAGTHLVDYERYRGATLTPEGSRAATAVVRRHRLLELFLHRMCGLRLDQVHREAETLEHAASDTFVDALDRLLGYPQLDPHGDPIPDRQGRMREEASSPLAELPVGARARVSRVEDGRPDALQHLMSLGLVPGSRIKLLRKFEFDGSIEVAVGAARVVLSRELADGLRVKAAAPRPGRGAIPGRGPAERKGRE
jgi:DtxR family transcriptional regulator, Mn-dependent transcriptional regulator